MVTLLSGHKPEPDPAESPPETEDASNPPEEKPVDWSQRNAVTRGATTADRYAARNRLNRTIEFAHK